MTRQELIANGETTRKEWEEKTMVGRYTIAELRKISDEIFDPQNWKGAWAADVPHQMVGIVLQAVEFFHADKAEIVKIVPITGKVRMVGKGYQAD